MINQPTYQQIKQKYILPKFTPLPPPYTPQKKIKKIKKNKNPAYFKSHTKHPISCPTKIKLFVVH